MTRHRTISPRERGFTITEILVATAIFAIIMVAVLLIYDRSNKVFKSGVEASDLQQNTRVAFDKLVADLRMAGFDFDRDGIPAGTGLGGVNLAQQPDEQIEYISNAAVTFRGNFDFNNDPTADDQGREFTTTAGNSGLENPEFPVVTTGNDEIVTYALVSVDPRTGAPIAANNTDSITFFADVPDRKARTGAGGRTENQVTISGIDLSNSHPPYTLMRIPVALTSTGAVAPVKIPIATSIRSLNLEYFTDQLGTVGLKDLAGTAIPPADYATTVGGLGQFDPNSPALIVPRAIRGTIQSVKLTLVGMTENQDPTYNDVTDPIAPRYRKYRLETLIVPRNTGRRGLREQDTTEPGVPVITTVCMGYCGLAYVAWDAPAAGGAVENYLLRWDTSPTGPFNSSVPAYGNSIYTPDLGSHTAQYYFKVQAINSYGNRTSAVFPSAGAGFSPINATKPWAPQSPQITGDGTIPALPNRIALAWGASLTPVATVTCTGPATPPTSFPVAEIGRWSVKRSLTAAFDPATQGTEVLSISTPVSPDASLQVVWSDTTAANCFNYYYRIQALESCPGAQSTTADLNYSDWTPIPASAALPGSGLSDVVPEAPSDLTFGAAPASECNAGVCTAQLIWPKVKLDVNGDPVTIGRYFVTRELIEVATGTAVEAAEVMEISLTAPLGANFDDPDEIVWSDDGSMDSNPGQPLLTPPAGQTYEYTVTAQQCSSAESAPSPARRFPCAFSPTLINAEVSGAIEGSGTAGDPWLIQPTSALSMEFSASVTGSAKVYLGGIAVQDLGTQTSTDMLWPIPDIADGTTYEVVASIVDANGCQASYTYYVDQTSSNCCLAPVSINGNVIVPDAVSRTVRVKLQNVCNDNLEIASIRIVWDSSLLSGGAKLDRVVYPATQGTCPTLVNTINSNNAIINSVPPSGTAMVSPDSTPQVGLANCPDPAGDEYRVDVVFNRGFTVSPITKLCVSYKRKDVATDAYVDLSNQNCQIVPAPSSTQNVCDP